MRQNLQSRTDSNQGDGNQTDSQIRQSAMSRLRLFVHVPDSWARIVIKTGDEGSTFVTGRPRSAFSRRNVQTDCSYRNFGTEWYSLHQILDLAICCSSHRLIRGARVRLFLFLANRRTRDYCRDLLQYRCDSPSHTESKLTLSNRLIPWRARGPQFWFSREHDDPMSNFLQVSWYTPFIKHNAFT